MTKLLKGSLFATVFALVTFILMSSACSHEDNSKLDVSMDKSTGNYLHGSYYVSVICSGSWTLSLQSTEGTVDWASVSPTSGTGDNGKVLFAYDDNYGETSRSLTIVLRNSFGNEATCSFTQEPYKEESSEGGSTGGDSGDDGPVSGVGMAVPNWLELPAVSDDDGLTYYYHTADFGGTTFRNYSFYWDKTNHLSRWVAYPLNDGLKSSGSRSNIWGIYDPLVPAEEQANMANSYVGNYDRGHQLPSADRLYSEPNRQTFYPTNMTPQRNNFNTKIWVNLESNVRGWASNSDTLYVVTGCVIDGYTTTTTDRDGLVCPIPVGYYKALLRYSKSSTIGYSGYMGAAFYLEHKDYSDTKIYASYSMSIDDLEEMLGIDFFVNLPDLIGETAAANVEKQKPADVSWWGLSN